MTSRISPEMIPSAPDLCLEESLWKCGIETIAGVDETGRGALAGPVYAAALILPSDPELAHRLNGVRDSKQLTPQQREFWSARLRALAQDWGIGFAEPNEIDTFGIIPATRLAAQRALNSLSHIPEHLLMDYLLLPEIAFPQTSLIKGDQRSLTIAAASIIAKTSRDAYLVELDEQYPGYDFAAHKGYATTRHRAAIDRLGPSPIHRYSFAPMRSQILD